MIPILGGNAETALAARLIELVKEFIADFAGPASREPAIAPTPVETAVAPKAAFV